MCEQLWSFSKELYMTDIQCLKQRWQKCADNEA
jgi:hypothetical protein